MSPASLRFIIPIDIGSWRFGISPLDRRGHFGKVHLVDRTPEANGRVLVCQSHGFARWCDIKRRWKCQQARLPNSRSIGVHQVDDMYGPVLRDHDASCGHAWVHAYIGTTAWERDRIHGYHVLEIKYIDEQVAHISRLIVASTHGHSTGHDKVMLRVHVVDYAGVGGPSLDDAEAQGIQDVDCRASRCRADVSTSPHELVVGLGGDDLDDLALVHVNDQHLVLLAGNNDLGRALGGEGHASQVFHGLVSNVPQRRASSHGHVDATRAEGDNALVVEEQLVNLAILGAMGLEGSVLVRMGRTVERGHSAIVVSRPEEFLARIEGECRDWCVMRSKPRRG